MVVRKLVDVGVGFYFQSSWNPVFNQCTTDDALTDLIKGFVTDNFEKLRMFPKSYEDDEIKG